ncbi:MAG: uroporphyrinogen decarboxylase [Magnetococcales bacterium]|nr:uroporphyrinogen decarboxylase [Magnetococcales bacterium]
MSGTFSPSSPPSPEPTQGFLRACLRLPVAETPLWLMRQAGRYLPEYRQVRAKAGDFLSLCKNPGLATEVTLQPVRRFGLDAAILFSDILVVPEAMGMSLRFSEGEGPILDNPLRDRAAVDRLRIPDPETALGYVMETVARIRRELPASVPLIGFSGSPWTLATYMVEGGSSKGFRWIKAMMYNDPGTLHALLERIADSVAAYLNAQIRHGAQAVQIFDTWGGVLTPQAFREFSLAGMARILSRLERRGSDGSRVPVILFAKGCGTMLEAMADTGCEVLGLDWTTPLDEARRRVGDRVALQGNMDPAVMYADAAVVRREATAIIRAFGANPGHVFNLGHGMAPDMDPERVVELVRAVRETSREILANPR